DFSERGVPLSHLVRIPALLFFFFDGAALLLPPLDSPPPSVPVCRRGGSTHSRTLGRPARARPPYVVVVSRRSRSAALGRSPLRSVARPPREKERKTKKTPASDFGLPVISVPTVASAVPSAAPSSCTRCPSSRLEGRRRAPVGFIAAASDAVGRPSWSPRASACGAGHSGPPRPVSEVSIIARGSGAVKGIGGGVHCREVSELG
ncbi:unnamed protein product, partial [Ixodes pacificus]